MILYNTPSMRTKQNATFPIDLSHHVYHLIYRLDKLVLVNVGMSCALQNLMLWESRGWKTLRNRRLLCEHLRPRRFGDRGELEAAERPAERKRGRRGEARREAHLGRGGGEAVVRGSWAGLRLRLRLRRRGGGRGRARRLLTGETSASAGAHAR
jgi:hypothetical protein